MSKKEQSENISAFSGSFTGGPHGLGDPEDRSMRKLEEQFINKLVKDHAHHTVCKKVVYEWGQCMEDNGQGWQGGFTWYTCRDQIKAMNSCLSHYYSDPAFREECREIYLNRRAKYRATGVMEKDPYVKKKYYVSERKEAFLNEFKEQKKSEGRSNKEDGN